MEDQLFDLFKDEGDNTVHMGKFLAVGEPLHYCRYEYLMLFV